MIRVPHGFCHVGECDAGIKSTNRIGRAARGLALPIHQFRKRPLVLRRQSPHEDSAVDRVRYGRGVGLRNERATKVAELMKYRDERDHLGAEVVLLKFRGEITEELDERAS